MTTDGLSPIVLSALMFTSPAHRAPAPAPACARRTSTSRPGPGAGRSARVFIAAVFPIACFYTGVKRVGASVAGLLSTAEPLVTVILAYIVLDESLTALQLAGGALIVTSVAALSLEGRRRPALAPS